MITSRNLVGLSNIGNTCYMNAVVQCVSSIPRLSNFPYVIQETDSRNNPFRSRFILSLSILIRSLQDSSNKYIAPFDLKSCLDIYKPFFKGNDMHDAEEFLDVVLDTYPQSILVS